MRDGENFHWALFDLSHFTANLVVLSHATMQKLVLFAGMVIRPIQQVNLAI